MASVGKKGFGTKFQYLASTGPDVWTDIGGILKVRPFTKKADVIDKSTMQSPSETREKMPGMIDNGDCVVEIAYDDTDAGHIWLEANCGVDAKQFRVIFPGTAPTKKVKTFGGFVQAVGPEVPYNDKMSCSFTVAISGVITTTADGS